MEGSLSGTGQALGYKSEGMEMKLRTEPANLDLVQEDVLKGQTGASVAKEILDDLIEANKAYWPELK